MPELDDLFNTYTDDQIKKDANKPKTVGSGSYTFQAAVAEPRESDLEFFQNGNPNPNYGRKFAHFYGQLEKDGERVGSLGFDASWEFREDERKPGRPDSQGRRWGQLSKVLDKATASVGEIIEAAKQYPIGVRVSQGWIIPGKSEPEYVEEDEQDKADEYAAAGYESRNYVQSIFKLK